MPYRVPTFRLNEPVAAVGAGKTFRSLYVMSPELMERLKAELTGYDVPGATIRFRPDTPLPEAIVAKVVKARLAENEARRH
jgi:uncharacterized protein YdhG (YjbR/CyaY superfamily)